MAWRLMSWDLPDHLLVVGCAVCAVLPFLARCHLKAIFPEISQVFVI